MLKYGGLAIIILLFGNYIKKTVPQGEKISQVKMEFLSYYSKYYICLRYIYVGRGLVEIITSLLIKRDLKDETSQILNIILLVTHIFTGTLPILLTIVKQKSPFTKTTNKQKCKWKNNKHHHHHLKMLST